MPEEWFQKWFNEDYLATYPHRDEAEAEGELDRLIELLELKPPLSLLDLGCGTGRHCRALAKRGFEVMGLDLSPTLLHIAQLRSPDIPYLRRDMRSFDDLGPFDLILNFFTSFGYFTLEEDQAVLDCVAHALKPGGRFFLDYLHPASISQPVEGDCVVKTIQVGERSYQERVRLYSREQLESLMRHAGLTPIAAYDDYEGEPWRPDGHRQLLVARR